MIQGVVTVNLEAIVPLTVMNDVGRQETFEAVLDTGFNGHLTLPAERIAALGFPLQSTAETVLADGQRVKVNIYLGKVIWHGQVRIVPVEEAPNAPLIGMELMLSNLLEIDVRYGGAATVTENP